MKFGMGLLFLVTFVLVTFMVITQVDADNGGPSIIGAHLESSSFESGNQGKILVYVQNTGGDDSFVAGLDSCSGVVPAFIPTPVQIASGQNAQLEVVIMTDGATTLDKNCNVRVTAINSGNYDTRSVNIKMTEPTGCEESDLTYSCPTCISNTIFICENGVYVPHEFCQYGITVNSGGDPVCRNNPASCVPRGNLIEDDGKPCCAGYDVDEEGRCNVKVSEFPISEIFLSGVVVIAFIVGYLLGKKKTKLG